MELALEEPVLRASLRALQVSILVIMELALEVKYLVPFALSP